MVFHGGEGHNACFRYLSTIWSSAEGYLWGTTPRNGIFAPNIPPPPPLSSHMPSDILNFSPSPPPVTYSVIFNARFSPRFQVHCRLLLILEGTENYFVHVSRSELLMERALGGCPVSVCPLSCVVRRVSVKIASREILPAWASQIEVESEKNTFQNQEEYPANMPFTNSPWRANSRMVCTLLFWPALRSRKKLKKRKCVFHRLTSM